MDKLLKYQVLFDNGPVAELAGFYAGANKATGLPIFKAGDKYYLKQNPTTSSIFASFARRGHPIYWELSEYPNRSEGLKYTGNIIIMFTLTTSAIAKKFFIKILKDEAKQLEAMNKKSILVECET